MENMEEKEAMTREEISQVNGGDAPDDISCIACALGGHKWELYEGISTWEQGENVQYNHLVCTRCHCSKYQKHYFATGKTVKISKSEFDSHR